MQHPVGYVLRNGRAEMNNFLAVVTQRFAFQIFLHTVSGAYILAGFFVMGISAYHLLRRQNTTFFTKSFRLALGFALIFSMVEIVQGHQHGAEVAKIQPTKLAAMESIWDTQAARPMYCSPSRTKRTKQPDGVWPHPQGLSMLAYRAPNAMVKGLKDFPKDDRPPVALTFVAFRLMVGLGFLFVLLTVWAGSSAKTWRTARAT